MDAAHLTNAHAYARAAYAVTNDNAIATKRHHAAAQQFGEAAKSVHDFEAVRILKLLEEHHEKLSRIVKSSPEPSKHDAQSTSPVPDHQKATDSRKPSGRKSEDGGPSSPTPTPTTKSDRRSSPVTQRRLQREGSSSIAHDLAAARGIPTGQHRLARQSSARHTSEGQIPPSIREGLASANALGLERKSDGQVQGLSPNGGTRGQAAPAQTSPPGAAEIVASEAAFQRFYSTIEGIWSKIPSPLAFTGLPLGTQDDTAQMQKAEPTVAKTTQPSSTADVNKYFSRAALRAIRDGNEPGPGVNDSFYVVPPGGGTVSYAGMLARERKHARSHSALSEQSEETEEKFVDAQETPQARISLSRIARRASSYRSPASNKTFEELEEENGQLKELTDELARRMYDYEKNSQKQFANMRQSMRFMPSHSNRESTESKGEPSVKQSRDLESRVTMLEKDNAQMKKENDRLVKENEKLTGVVARYRERWESLKQSARGRRDAGAVGEGAASTANAASKTTAQS